MESNALISFDNLAAVLNEYGAAVVEAYKNELKARGKDTEKAHANSLQRDIRFEVDGGGLLGGGAAFEVLLHLPAHWYNVEFGRKPCPPSKHWVPVDALIKWIEVKPVIPRPDKNGRIPTVKQLAFMINRAINDPDRTGTDPKRPGIAPEPVMQASVQAVNARYDALIKAAISRDLNVFLNAISFSDFSTRGHARAAVVSGPHKKR